jgi:hypothetical protein
MPTRHLASGSRNVSASASAIDPGEPVDPDVAARELERELTDCNDPAAMEKWCAKALPFLEKHLQSHEDYRHHHGDSVCHIIARAAHARAQQSMFCPVELVRLLGPLPLVPPGIAGNMVLANLQRLAQCARAQIKTIAPAGPPLTDTEQRVLDLIQAVSQGKGITGRQIIAKLDKEGFLLDQGTLTRHVIPILKKSHGVKNRPGVGYYCERT